MGYALIEMTIDAWLEMATRDAERRGLSELKPMLEMLARATSALRAADWNADASGAIEPADQNPETRTPNPESRISNPESR